MGEILHRPEYQSCLPGGPPRTQGIVNHSTQLGVTFQEALGSQSSHLHLQLWVLMLRVHWWPTAYPHRPFSCCPRKAHSSMLSRRPAGHRRSAKPGLHGNPSSRSTFLQDGSGLEPGVLLSLDKTRYAWRKQLRNRRLGKALSRSFHDRPFLCQSVPPANAILKSNFSWPQEGRWLSSNPSKSPGQELRVHTGRGLVGWPRIMLLLSVRPRTPTS